MTGLPIILAAAELPPASPSKSDKLLESTEFWVAIGLLVLLLFGGAVVLYFVDAWRKRQLSSDEDSAESLTSFRAMYERGELTEAEYQKVRDRVARRVKQEVAAANPAAARGQVPPASPVNGGAPGGGEKPADGAAPPPPPEPSG